jgi:hypothetical protein
MRASSSLATSVYALPLLTDPRAFTPVHQIQRVRRPELGTETGPVGKL